MSVDKENSVSQDGTSIATGVVPLATKHIIINCYDLFLELTTRQSYIMISDYLDMQIMTS